MPRPKKNRTSVPDTPSAQLLAKKPEAPKTSKSLLEDSDSEEEFHSAQQSAAEAGFKINEEYAQRFEHNKKREELHRLEEKFGPNSKKHRREDDHEDSEDESSSSEDEDDIGVLATELLDEEIFATLAAIKNKDPRVYDRTTSFYAPVNDSTAEEVDALKREKPMFLRDYHRESLLAGNIREEGDTEGKLQTFAQQQEYLKRSVIKEMHTAAEAEVFGSEDEDGAFLVCKPSSTKDKTTEKNDLPDPSLADKDPDEFLNQFLASRAWAKTSSTAFVPLESDDSEEDANAEEYEFNYNMRFEDPDAAARARLISYGRDAIGENTVRREERSRRKRAREEKRRKKEEEKRQSEVEKGRLKKLKTEELIGKFKQIKEAAELNESDEEAEAAVLSKLLEGDFSDGEWDQWMQERFGDKYYNTERRPNKPEFEDDIDIGDIVPNFEDGLVNEEDEEEIQDKEVHDADATAETEADNSEEPQPEGRKSKKEIIKEKQARKAKDRSTRRKVERFVEDNFDFHSELPGGRGSGFRYRETTPEAYGLGTLDILAADDADLNAYVGLKKYAAFRDPEKKKKDKKRYAKKKLLKQWRKEVFGNSSGMQLPPGWEPAGLVEKKAETADIGKVDIRGNGGGERKKKRKKNKEKP